MKKETQKMEFKLLCRDEFLKKICGFRYTIAYALSNKSS